MERRPDWLLDEMASAGRENLDPEHVARYDDKEDAGAAAEVTLLVSLGLGADSVVVDLGAGTGQFTLAAARVCSRVIAVDVSPVMREALEARVAAAGASNVHVVAAGFLTYDHVGPHADFVYSRFALHHLPDFWKVLTLRRIRAICRTGAVLRLSDVVYSGDPEGVEERLAAWCAAFDDSPDGGWTRVDVEEHIRDEHSTFTWLLEPMMERSGFAIEQREYSGDGIFARYVARAA